MTGDKAEHLTQAQKDQLEAELAELEGPRRAEAVAAIKPVAGTANRTSRVCWSGASRCFVTGSTAQ